MLGSERGVVEEWLSEFKVNQIEDNNVSYESISQYLNSECIFYGETVTNVIICSRNSKI